MKFKIKLSIILLIIVGLIIGTYFVIFSRNNITPVDDTNKTEIEQLFKNSIGETPNLQTDSCRAGWAREAHIQQTVMMDKVLSSLKINGESSKGKPKKFIIGSYKTMNLYIPYKDSNPETKIIVEVNNHYYVATGKKQEINEIITYMRKQLVLK